MAQRKPWSVGAWTMVLATVAMASGAHGQDGPPPPPRDVRGAVDDLDLPPEQRATVDPVVAEFQRKQREARDEMLRQMRAALTPAQYQRFVAAIGRPPQPGDDGNPTPVTPTTRPMPPLAAGERRVAVTFTGGHDTDRRDGGRPVTLVASALGVPAEVFRQTFTHVRPARGGAQPEPDQVRQNKAALLQGLSPYGVTNDRLDEVSNYYRYPPGRGHLWRTRPAVAFATVKDGTVTAITVTDGGAGYTTPPTVAIAGLPDVAATAALAFGTDLATNGSVRAVTVASTGR